MAPVGSWESLAAAIAAGADAVYFGIRGLNMRNGSSHNFSLDDMDLVAMRCRDEKVKTYLTVNTVLYDADIPTMHEIVDRAKAAGITAIIATDIATIRYCADKGVPVHISTQANITNTEAVRWYAQWADVMVLAREMNLDQVKEVHHNILTEPITGPNGEPVRLEMFCHGALCMAVSGKCYMSLHMMNRSANRGECNQICRRGYTVRDRETGDELDIENQFVMSPKDLKTIGFLDKIIDAGVRVFKIEGRARGPEYVYETVRAYSEAIEAICDGTYSEEKVAQWDERLAKVFHRGFWDGYYLGQRLGEWSTKYGSSATRTKHYVGKAVKYFSRLGIGEFKMEAGELHVGDEVIVTGPTTGAEIFTVSELRKDLKPVEMVRKGDSFSMPVPGKVRASDKLYRWEESNVVKNSGSACSDA